MGKFDKYNKPNFKPKGLLALALFLGIIIVFIIFLIKKYFCKKEDSLNKTHKKNPIDYKIDYSNDATSLVEYSNNKKISKISENEKLSKQTMRKYKDLVKNKIYK